MKLSARLRASVEDLIQHFRAEKRWRRLLKYNLALATAITLSILPPITRVFGTSTYMIPLQLVFAPPSQRAGSLIESQSLILLGGVIGVAWGALGLYLADLVGDGNRGAALGIRALFLGIVTLVHGFFRSNTPKLFGLVYLMLMDSFAVLISSYDNLSVSLVTSILYPTLTGHGIILLFGYALFPESSASYLGETTINMLSDTLDTLTEASTWFIAPENELEHALSNPLMRAPTADSNLTQLSHDSRTAETTALPRMGSVLQNPLAHVRWGKPDKKSKQLKKEKKEKKKKEKAMKKALNDDARFEKEVKDSEKDKADNGASEAEDEGEEESALEALTKAKGDLRHTLSGCQTAQREVSFELSFSALPLDVMRPITTEGMANLVQETIRVVGACENKLVMIEDDKFATAQCDGGPLSEKSAPPTARTSMEAPTDAGPASSGALLQPLYYRTLSTPKEEFLEKLKRVKPAREMEAGDAELLDGLVSRIKKPTEIFQGALRDAVHFLMASLAYCYDVEELPSGAKVPRGILLEEIDVFIDAFEDAIGTFDYDTSDGFREFTDKGGNDEAEVAEILPQFETFLVSSFLLGFRQAAIHILEMLRYTRLLVEARQRRKDRRRIYWPRLADWMEWLYLGGEHDAMVLPKGARRSTHSAAASTPEKAPKTLDADELSLRTEGSLMRHITRDTETGRSRAGSIARESQASKKKKKKKKKSVKFKDSSGLKKPSKSSWIMTLRGRAADAVEWVRESDDVEYAFKLLVAVALVTWPAFLPSWRTWYVDVRGLWAPLQLVLVFEVSIGTSLIVFFMRLGGVIVGCTTGYIAYLAGQHVLALAIIIQMLVIIPSTYIQLETKYVKAGIVCITSSAVVTCASFSNSKSAVVIYYTRLASFLIGGTVAILVEVCLYPVRARDRLIQSLSSAIQEILRVQGAVSIGIDDPDLGHHSARAQAVFTSSRNRSRAALAAAENFLPFCVSEPRLKGDFTPLVPVYTEIIFVLHQILDRMDNVVSLRNNYGYSVLKELNPLIYTYRRNVAGGVTISIFAVNEALTTRLPLPQFLPSNRTAQLRLITRVREVVATRRLRDPTANISRPATPTSDASSLDSEEQVSVRHRVLSWNAETAGQMEIIEYIEELVELAKLLVGVNAFRGGMLEKPDLGTYIRGGKRFADPALPRREQVKPKSGLRRRLSLTSEDAAASGVQLRRAATISGPVSRWVQRRRKLNGFPGWGNRGGREAKDDEPDEADEPDEHPEMGLVPNSLRRVGSRLRKDSHVSRRLSRHVTKGKSVERSA